MSSAKKQPKKRLHPRNRNRDSYDLDALVNAVPALADYIQPNKHGADSIDFANPVAVRLLNQALLKHYYGIEHWAFPAENLCPPIPGRADYLHHVADLLSRSQFGKIPRGAHITCLDIGVGANCIYPIIGVTEYGWSFIGADIDSRSLASARQIVATNPSLAGKVECRLQENPRAILPGVINEAERIDVSICNPPFHASAEAARQGTRRKIKNLSGKKVKMPTRNFSGIHDELICEGGEHRFIHTLIDESKAFAKSCFWFSTLVSKKSNLKGIYRSLEQRTAERVETIPLGTGNKSSRIVAWTFLSKAEQKEWVASRS